MKPLNDRYDLTPIGGNQIRKRGWRTTLGLDACVDCGGQTAWRSPDDLAQHPWPCVVVRAR